MKYGLPIKLELPDGFLDPEIRCGYQVTGEHKRIWAVELDLLAELLRVCSKHNINVQVYAGTLLGAVRHGGFIPWDDDLDVCMTYDDYSHLCKIADKEFKFPYFFQNGITDNHYFFGFARLRNSLTTGAVKGFEAYNYNNGIFIDINILNTYPTMVWLDRIKFIVLRIVSRLIKERVTIDWSFGRTSVSFILFFGLFSLILHRNEKESYQSEGRLRHLCG